TTREEGQRGNSASISAATGISDLEQVLQQKTFTRLDASTSGSLKKHGDERDNLHAITTPMVTSREEITSPVELAKAYMGFRPSKAALRQDLVLHNNATGFLKSPNTLIAPKIANGFTTPRSRGRSAMCNMARTPYARSPSTFTEKENGIPWKYALITNIMRHVFYVLLSRGDKIGWLYELAKWVTGEMGWIKMDKFESGCVHALCLALKRKSSILDDDIGSGGPLRRTRQKANLALKRRSSVLDDDIGSGGPLRRTRQKANLALKRRSSVLDDDIGSGGPLRRI
ncbi:hypothetical protein Tco_1426335, partial [Tanacetum coccineum]